MFNSFRRQADKAAFEAGKLLRIQREQTAVAQLQRDIKSKQDTLGEVALALYRTNELSHPRLLAVCQQITALEARIKEHETRIEEIRIEELDAPPAAPAVASTINCPECEAAVPEVAAFCPSCGHRMSKPESTLVTCAHCGAQVKTGAQFCPACGNALASQPGTIHCSNCGTLLPAGIVFCPECGTRVVSSESTQISADTNDSRPAHPDEARGSPTYGSIPGADTAPPSTQVPAEDTEPVSAMPEQTTSNIVTPQAPSSEPLEPPSNLPAPEEHAGAETTLQATKICPNCSSELPAEALFCPECGTHLA